MDSKEGFVTPKKCIPIGMYTIDAEGDICIEFKKKRKGSEPDYETVKVTTLIAMLLPLLNRSYLKKVV